MARGIGGSAWKGRAVAGEAVALLVLVTGLAVPRSEGAGSQREPVIADCRNKETGSGVGVVIAAGEPYEFVLMPVRAPNLIGWVGMGFLIDEGVTEEINALTGLEISIVTYDASGNISYLASSHQAQLAMGLMSGHSDKLMEGAYTARSQMSEDDNYLSYASTLLADQQHQSFALIQLSREELLAHAPPSEVSSPRTDGSCQIWQPRRER